MSYDNLYLLVIIITILPFFISIWLFVHKSKTWSETKRYMIAVAGLVFALIVIFLAPQDSYKECEKLTATVVIDNHTFNAEVFVSENNAAGVCRYRGIGSESEWGEWQYYIGIPGQWIWLK